MKHYQRLGLEQLVRERTRLMEIKRTLMDQQKSRKQQLSKIMYRDGTDEINGRSVIRNYFAQS